MRWQYELVHAKTRRWVIRPDNPPFVDETLAERAKDGWELVKALPCDNDDVLLNFKKELSADAPVIGFNLAPLISEPPEATEPPAAAGLSTA
jgi:hypothetical protein